MRIEDRVDGAKIMRPGSGRQRLLVATTHPAELVVVCEMKEVISVKRHWSEELQKSVACDCTGPCPTSRLDRFLAVLYRVGPTIWEERLLVIADQGWHCLLASLLVKGFPHDRIWGARVILRRVGPKSNGRTEAHVQDFVKSTPGGFDIPAAMRNGVGIAADFFGDSEGAPVSDQVALPIKTRSDKPRVDKGRR